MRGASFDIGVVHIFSKRGENSGLPVTLAGTGLE